MLDIHTVAKPPISRIEVADYIEMGRLVAQWATDPATRPDRTSTTLKDQLDGIAMVPDRIKTVEFVQSTLDHLILRLPVKEMIEESLERMTDPIGDGRYPLPQFYADYLPPRLRAGDDPARHPAGQGRRLHHCPVPLTAPGLTPQPLRPVASSLTNSAAGSASRLFLRAASLRSAARVPDARSSTGKCRRYADRR